MNVIMIVIVVLIKSGMVSCLRHNCVQNLKNRERGVRAYLKSLNMHYEPRGIRWAVGPYGHWLELDFDYKEQAKSSTEKFGSLSEIHSDSVSDTSQISIGYAKPVAGNEYAKF